MSRRVIAAILFIFVSAVPALAAEISRQQNLAPRLQSLKMVYPGGWSGQSVYDEDVAIFKISGVIEKGDLEKLKAAIYGKLKVLVFDSPGGSFLEGIRIGRYLQENAGSQDPNLLGVFVLNGDECLSACALAFTLAATPRNILHGSDSRYVEAGARLGYHMAFLPEDKANQLVAVQQAMNLAYEVTQTYTSLIRGGLTPPVLLEEALSHRTAESFFMLTGDIRTFSMGMTPVASNALAAPLKSTALYMDTVNAICFQLFTADSAIKKSEVEYEYGFIRGGGPAESETKLEDMMQLLGSRKITAGHNGVAHCVVELSPDGHVGISMQQGAPPCSRSDFTEPAWCALEYSQENRLSPITNALLADTAGCHGGKLTRKASFWVDDAISYAEEGTEQTKAFEPDWTSQLARDVNVRAQPSLIAAIVGSLKAGDTPTISNCRVMSDNQGVWYELASGGWISARFVSSYPVHLRPYVAN